MTPIEVLVRTSKGNRRFTIDDTFFESLGEVERANKQSSALFIASSLSLLSDSPLGLKKPPSVYSKYLREFRILGVKKVILKFTSLAHQLVSQLTDHHNPSIGTWIEGFRDTPIFKEYHTFYLTGRVDIIRWIYTFLNFGKKLEYKDPSFNEVAFRDWIHNEKRLSDLSLPEDLTSHLRKILSVLLPTFKFSDFRPKFGPGSVAEPGIRGRKAKIRNLAYDPLIDRFIFHGHIGNYGLGDELGLLPSKVLPLPDNWSADRGVSSRTSRLMFVPKNIKTARSICMEPNSLMFFQQAILDEMVVMISRSQLGRFIRLSDQSFNKKLSLLGSISGKIDTLDLSSASDCLSYDLVKKVFPPSWQIVMRVSRSSRVVLPGGDLHTLMKFAPMGSALCFPTQCIVFCAVCILAACFFSYDDSGATDSFENWLDANRISDVVSRFWQHTSLTSIGFQPLGIYGDDICLDSRLTDRVMSILTSLGFLVNKEKSFVAKQLFRESCGGFYLRGHDVTPLYFTVKGVRKFTTSSHVASQVSLLNAAWVKRYKTLYRFLRHSILTWDCKDTCNPIPHVNNPLLFGILCTSPSNSHLKKRYNKNYQRDEMKGWTISYKEKDPYGDLLGALDSYLYMRWWASHRVAFSSYEDSSSMPRYDTGSPGLVWRWMPDQ